MVLERTIPVLGGTLEEVNCGCWSGREAFSLLYVRRLFEERLGLGAGDVSMQTRNHLSPVPLNTDLM